MLNIIQLRKDIVTAGMPGDQADLIVDALQKNRDDFSNHHATKEQLDTLDLKLSSKIDKLELIMDVNFKGIDTRFDAINSRLTQANLIIPLYNTLLVGIMLLAIKFL